MSERYGTPELLEVRRGETGHLLELGGKVCDAAVFQLISNLSEGQVLVKK